MRHRAGGGFSWLAALPDGRRRGEAAAQSLTAIKVMSFPGMTNFPIFAAQHKGLFAKHGLAVELLSTVNSKMQRDGLAKGEQQIIQSAADNAVAMVELAKQDAVIVTGGDNGFNRISSSRRSNRSPTCAATPWWSTRPTPPSRCCSTRR